MSAQLTSSLLSFRLAYLMSITEAWQNEQYKEELLDCSNVLAHPGFTRYLPNEDPVQWKASIILKENGLRWKPEGAPVGSNGWMGPYDDFVIKMPNRPTDSKQKPIALSAYYQQFPTFFGGGHGNLPGGTGAVAANAVTKVGGLGIGGPETFLSFGALTLRVIAYAWENEEFFNKLTDPDVNNAAELLTEYFQFTNPWNFNIRFERDENFNWDSEKGWPTDIMNRIELNFPDTPNMNEQAIAIASYNDSGPAYPYSCN